MTRLTIDGYVLRFPRSGIVNYVFNVVSELARQPGFDISVLLEDLNFSDAEISTFVRGSLNTRFIDHVEESGWLNRLNAIYRDRKLAVRLPNHREIDCAVAPGDIYFATDWYHYPARHARYNVLTYFDLTAKLHPNFHEHTNIVKETRKARAAREFDHIVAISEATKSDLINHLRIPENKITTSYLGVDSVYERLSRKSRKTFLPKYNIDPSWRYILSVCTIEPRKNVIGMLNAFRILRENPAFHDVRLVLSGNIGWRNEELKKFMDSYSDRDKIIFAGYVALEDMPSLYSHAEAFLFLSFYEGFGIPILEAMKSSCPVVCSNVSSMPEVIGDCGETVSPQSAEEAAAALARILDNSAYADSLRFAGYVRSKKFAWRNHVEKLVQVFNNA